MCWFTGHKGTGPHEMLKESGACRNDQNNRGITPEVWTANPAGTRDG